MRFPSLRLPHPLRDADCDVGAGANDEQHLLLGPSALVGDSRRAVLLLLRSSTAAAPLRLRRSLGLRGRVQLFGGGGGVAISGLVVISIEGGESSIWTLTFDLGLPLALELHDPFAEQQSEPPPAFARTSAPRRLGPVLGVVAASRPTDVSPPGQQASTFPIYTVTPHALK